MEWGWICLDESWVSWCLWFPTIFPRLATYLGTAIHSTAPNERVATDSKLDLTSLKWGIRQSEHPQKNHGKFIKIMDSFPM